MAAIEDLAEDHKAVGRVVNKVAGRMAARRKDRIFTLKVILHCKNYSKPISNKKRLILSLFLFDIVDYLHLMISSP